MSLSVGVRKTCLFVFALGTFVLHALAASPVCKAGWEWASNSKQQNPCEIAGALLGECLGVASGYKSNPLRHDTIYLPHVNDNATQTCDCNTVIYSLCMACAACQGVTPRSWGTWSRTCAATNVSHYPWTIPLGTAIPLWALMDYRTDPDTTFDPITAKSLGGLPEELPPSLSSTVSLSGSLTGSGSTPSLISTNPTSVPTSSSSGGGGGGDDDDDDDDSDNSNGGDGNPTGQSFSRVPGIVGGVIGGLVFLATSSIGAWIFHRRRVIARTGRDHLDDAVGIVTVNRDSKLSIMELYDPFGPSIFHSQNDYGANWVRMTPPNNGRFAVGAEL